MTGAGKKRRSILPSLPSFVSNRDSDSTPRDKKDKSLTRGSTVSMSAYHDNRNKDCRQSEREDSIEEMASMLLEDTEIDQLKAADPGKCLSQIGCASGLSSAPQPTSGKDKSLPQLPALLFNGDDAWALKTCPAVTAAGSCNMLQFQGNSEDQSSYPPSIPKHSVKHTRKSSAPVIPRRSSKRKSGRPKSGAFSSPQKTSVNHSRTSSAAHKLSKSISTPNNLLNIPEAKPSNSVDAAGITGKIESMLAATQALKGTTGGTDSPVLPEPLVPTKKRRLKDNKVLVKMKTALNDRLNSRSTRKVHDPVRDDRLLDTSFNEMPDVEDELAASLSALTSLEIRMNEGANLRNAKINRMTGHGKIARKPVAEDGKSFRTKKSCDDPFSERSSCSGQRRMTTSFEHRLREDMSIDFARDAIPDVPKISRSLTGLPMVKRGASPSAGFEADFDVFLSSSPLAQSTPRIRLEPAYEQNGKRTLKNVLAESRSLFDPDTSITSQNSIMDVDEDLATTVEIPSGADAAMKKSRRASKLSVSASSKKSKKHPSPSKAALENLERELMDKYPDIMHPNCFQENTDEESLSTNGHFQSASVLTSRDPNERLTEPKAKGIDAFTKLEATRSSADSLQSIHKRSRPQRFSLVSTPSESMVPSSRHSKRESLQFTIHTDFMNDSKMEIDELQLDDSKYNIGRRL